MTSRYGRGDRRVSPGAPSSVDLHTHTRRSDGVLEPETLVRAAAEAGVRLLAITDHDSLSAYRQMAARIDTLAPALELLAGVEINAVSTESASLADREIHILGFGMDPADDRFEATLARQREQRRHRFDRAVTRLRDLGLGIDEQLTNLDRTTDDALGRPTLARALIAAGHATTVDDAFARLLGYGRPAYVARVGLGPLEAIRAISAAGGLAVLAHFAEAPARTDIVQELRDGGLGGLEVHYRRFDERTVAALGVVADRMGLLRTGGSDFHGDDESYAQAHAGLAVPDRVGETLRATLAAR